MGIRMTEEIGLAIKRGVANIPQVTTTNMNISMGGFTIVAYVDTRHPEVEGFRGHYDAKLIVDAELGYSSVTVKLINPDNFRNDSDVIEDEFVKLFQFRANNLYSFNQELDYKEYTKWELGHELELYRESDVSDVVTVAKALIKALGDAWKALTDQLIDLD